MSWTTSLLDLHKRSTKSCKLFDCAYDADDTSLCLKSNDIFELNKAMNRDLEDLDSWLKGNKLSLKVVKTK